MKVVVLGAGYTGNVIARAIINIDYFKKIDTIEKAYFLGFFFGDGYISTKRGIRNRIGIEIGFKDVEILYRWCGIMGLNPNFIHTRIVTTKAGKHVKMAYIEFASKEMADDIIKLGFEGSKSLKTKWPDVDFDSDLALGFLLGFYDAEGTQKSTDITCGSRDILDTIKDSFNLPYKIGIKKSKNKKTGKVYTGYYLALGGKLLNLMMDNYKNSLKRKRKKFQIQTPPKSLDNIIDRKLLQKLVNEMPISHIAKKYKVDFSVIKRLMKKYGISPKPPYYWRRLESRNPKL